MTTANVNVKEIIEPRAMYLALDMSLINDSGKTIVPMTIIGTKALNHVIFPSTLPIALLGTPISRNKSVII